MINVQYLYFFSSDDICLIETKRTDLSSDASLSDIYKWLVYSRISGEVTALRFLKMTRGESYESRSFAEGELKFDSSAADFTYMERANQLLRMDPSLIDPTLDERIKKFLLGLTK